MISFIKKQLKKIENKSLRRVILSVLLAGSAVVLAVVAIYSTALVLGPPPLSKGGNTIYYSDEEKVIGEEHGPESRYWVSLDEMSPMLIKAALTTEDKRFYSHHGLDVKRILSAAWNDLQALSKVQGASTITQQLARNLYLSHEKTWARKLKEAFYAIRLEMFYDKKEILEGYLNTIYYGHGAYGVEAASRYFFDKSAKQLDLAEAALLTGIPKGPSYYSPYRHLDNAKNRQEQILGSLEQSGLISEDEQYLAARQTIQLTEHADEAENKTAPYFLDTVLAELQDILDMDAEAIRSGGYQVYTTLNLEQQQQMEEAVNKSISDSSELQVGAVAQNPKNGAVKAMVGGRNYADSQYNRVTQAKRMPGSSFKPFLYYAALENGYTPVTSLLSKPTSFELEDGTVYQPSNYNGYYANEPITLAQALALSDNVYAVKTNLFLGPKELVETAKKFGIEEDFEAVPSLALGTGAVTVNEMAAAYGMLANGGKSVEPFTIKKVTDSHGKVLYAREKQDSSPVLDPVSTFILTDLMTGMFDESLNGYMRVTGASIADGLTRSYSGKSGTTKTDNWMVGFSPDLVTSVWTGFDENKPVENTNDLQAAKSIWAGFMEKAHADLPFHAFPVPDGVVGAYVDPVSGELATPYCDQHRLMYFAKGTEPTSYCSLHHDETNENQEQLPEEEDGEQDSGWKRWFKWLSRS
ncbi:PBP1A family penicillin-binding protein [Sediminibacillus dalangtanensis]|uniref:PBP1A family penicillin-binding protein n=1 Tax=Sediminibacillus dalangtanensis TaxID=2729421 RepID=A0ABX7W1C2_9BACI|nr:PBP1A family penicillin-binding protein [Sediminibacillus dalangtanensis]QTN00903.1 PBP1A family penicillin-binding protein [Sediminibacillus dalangtanensis]